MHHFSPIALAALLALSGCETKGDSAAEDHGGAARAPLGDGSREAAFDLLDLPTLASPGEPFVEAPWGDGEGDYGREVVGAQTGPMALTALSEGLAVLDTVNGRVHRYDDQGARLVTQSIDILTGDDLAALPGGGLAVLVYRRVPTPGYEVLVFDREGHGQRRDEVPEAATMPTALLSTSGGLYVESRHGYAHALDGSRRLWGRPVGEDLLVRARLAEGGQQVTLTARSRGQGRRLAWSTTLSTPWPVTELLALEANERTIALALRRVEDPGLGPESPQPAQQSWLVTFDRSGRALGRLALRDRRITDAARPLALSSEGDLFELVTDPGGVTVLRYRGLGQGGQR